MKRASAPATAESSSSRRQGEGTPSPSTAPPRTDAASGRLPPAQADEEEEDGEGRQGEGGDVQQRDEEAFRVDEERGQEEHQPEEEQEPVATAHAERLPALACHRTQRDDRHRGGQRQRPLHRGKEDEGLLRLQFADPGEVEEDEDGGEQRRAQQAADPAR